MPFADLQDRPMDDRTNHGAADIIIPVFNRYPCTRDLLEGIYRYTDHPFHIYLIDNASTDETVDLNKIYTRQITIIRNRENRGWCGGINQGIKLGCNPYVVFLNNETEVSHGWLGNLIAFLDTHPRIGAVGPMDSSPSDSQCVDRVRETLVPQIPAFFTNNLHERNRILKYHFHRTGILVEGMLAFFCCLLRRRTIDGVGLLDEALADVSAEEDYCRRLRKAGYVLGLSVDTYVIRRSNSPGQLVPVDETRRNLTHQKEKQPA